MRANTRGKRGKGKALMPRKSGANGGTEKTIIETLRELDEPQTTAENIDAMSMSSSEEEHTPRTEKMPFQPSRSQDWTDDDEALLCDLWKEERHLYDKADKNYRNAQLKSATLTRIAVQLNKEGKRMLSDTCWF